jgi:membrane protease YdiL (CAAX protease family)
MRLISNFTVWLSLALVVLLFVPFVAFIPRQSFFEGLNAICMAVAAGVMVGYGKPAWTTMRLPIHKVDSAELLVVGIVVCSLAIVGIFGGLWLWRALDKPDYVIDSVEFAFTRWLFAFGAFTVLVSAQSSNGAVNGRAYGKAGLVVAAAVFVAATLISLGIG